MARSATFQLTNGISNLTVTLVEDLATGGVVVSIFSTAGSNVDIRGIAFDVIESVSPGTDLGIDITGADVKSSASTRDLADSVTTIGNINFSGSPYDVGVIFNRGGGSAFVSSTTFTLTGVTLDELANQRFTAQVTGVSGSPSFFGTAPAIAPPPATQFDASLQYVLPSSEAFIYQRPFDGQPTVFIQPDADITAAQPVIQKAVITNTGTSAATGLKVLITSENPYLALFGIDVNGDGTADSSNSDFTITSVNNSDGSQAFEVTVNKAILPGQTIEINGLLALENRQDTISQVPFFFELIDGNGNLAFRTVDTNLYLSSLGFSSAAGSSAFVYSPLADHQGALSLLNYTDTTTGNDAVNALLPRIGGTLVDGQGDAHKIVNLAFEGDIDLFIKSSTRIYSDVLEGLATWAWYAPPGVDLDPFIEASGTAAHNILVDLLPTLGQQYLAAPVLTSGGQTVESKFVTNNGQVFTIRAGRLSDGSPPPQFKTFTYSGGSKTFQQFYEQTAAANPNTQLKFVITTTAPLNFSNYSSLTPLNGSPIVVLEFANSTQALFQTLTTGESVDFSEIVIANKTGTQIGVTYTGDINSNNVQGDRIIGTDYRDSLRGANSSDQLIGLDGNDDLYGGNGGDILWGGQGADRIDLGGGSKDIVVFDRTDLGQGVDTVLQFSKNQDVIGLSGGLTYGTGNSATDVYLSGNTLKVGSTSLAVLEGFSGTLSASNFTVKNSAQDFFSIPIPS